MSFNVRDRFQAGILDTRVVDPGGEYFFGLGHFRRNDVNAGASIAVGPRLSVELAGALGAVRFQEPASFFPYDTRSASAGFGFELTPNLKAVASYVYDAVPRPDERPEAELTANSARLSLGGEILPLLTGDLSVGYRSQDSPNAGPGGTSYSGFVMSAALTRQLGRESSLGIYASRTTPVSAYEENGFYVSNSVQGTLQVPLLAQFRAPGRGRVPVERLSDRGGRDRRPARGPHPRLVRGPAPPRPAEPVPERGLSQRGPPVERGHLRLRRRRVLLPARVGHLRRTLAMSALAAATLLLLAQAPAAGAETLPYRVGPGDVLEVVVDGRPDLSRLPTVQTTGSVWLPRAGEVEVRGLSTGEIAARLTPLLAGEDLASPRVAVRVREYQSQFVWVRGAVQRPGRKPLRSGTRLLDALLDAGGFQEGASGEVAVERAAGTFADGSRAARFRFGGKEPDPAGARRSSACRCWPAT